MTNPTCIICGCEKSLVPHRNSDKRKCPDCSSLPRHRNLFKYLAEGNKTENKAVLHIAPEKCLFNYVRESSRSCHFVDKFNPSLKCSKDDITDMGVFIDGAFDIAICFHVLEHIKDDAPAIKELARVLKKGGVLLLSVPLISGNTHHWTEQEINDQKNMCKKIKKKFHNAGFSDHTLNSTAAIGAVFYGADVIEKHFTLSKKMYGSDAKYAMEPDEFFNYCQSIREAKKIYDTKLEKIITSDLEEMRHVFQKSVCLSKDLVKNHRIKFEDLAFKKPGSGVSASEYKFFIGKKLIRDCYKNQFLTKKLIKI